MEKMGLNHGTYTIMKWRAMEPQIAKIKYGFTKGVWDKRELSSEIAFRALSISITTKTERESVEALTLPLTK